MMIPPRRPRRFAALLAAGLLPVAAVTGCGGGEQGQVVAPAPAPANPAPARPAPAPTPESRSASTPRSRSKPSPAALRALPLGAARYGLMPAGPEGVEPGRERANFLTTGRTRPPEDAVRATVVSLPKAEADRYEIGGLPEPPGGAPAVRAPEGFEILPGGGAGPGGLPRRMRATRDGMVACLVPAGVVRLGDPGSGGERPQAFVSSFYMDQHEVTVAQFRQFLEQSGERTDPPTNLDGPDDHPAVGLSWRSAFLYARWAGRALPTEAEWVRAARGDDDFLYPWGNAQPMFASTRRPGTIDPVMSDRMDRSPFGVFDLAGNAGEWTLQNFVEDPLRGERKDAAGLYRNPDRGSGAGGAKTVRGLGEGWTPARRTGRDGTDQLDGVGFRCVWRPTVDGSPGGDPLNGLTAGAGT